MGGWEWVEGGGLGGGGWVGGTLPCSWASRMRPEVTRRRLEEEEEEEEEAYLRDGGEEEEEKEGAPATTRRVWPWRVSSLVMV